MGELLGYLFFFGFPAVCVYVVFSKIYRLMKGKDEKRKYSWEEIHKCQAMAKTMFGQTITESEAFYILENAERQAEKL